MIGPQVLLYLDILNRINQVKKFLPGRDSELETGLEKLYQHYRQKLLEEVKGLAE
jgi:hypothetical protein